MTNFFNKFKIPTLLGLGIIILGLASGLYLVLREQVFLSQAAPDLTPQNITITNITDDSAVISWQTNAAAASFITFGQKNPGEETLLDDRDGNPAPDVGLSPKDGAGPKPHLIHYVTVKNLLPNTHYLFKITSGKLISEVMKFDTATPVANQNGFTPVIGSVMDGQTPLNDGIAYLSIQDAVVQSSLVKTGGNFLIPLSQIRTTDFSNIFPLTEETIAKLTIFSERGSASIQFKLQANSSPLPPIKLGQNIDLTIPEETPQSYDLNDDGTINVTDYAILSSCFGKNPSVTSPGGKSCAKADINGDGKIDQKDLDLMSQKLKNQ